MALEIVDFPIEHGGFSIAMLNYRRVWLVNDSQIMCPMIDMMANVSISSNGLNDGCLSLFGVFYELSASSPSFFDAIQLNN